MSLDGLSVPDMAAEAVEAQVSRRHDQVEEVLARLLVEGSKRDALTFTVACLYLLASAMTPGQLMVAGPVSVSPLGEVSLIHDTMPGHRLYAEMLSDLLAGKPESVILRWLAAEDDDACGAVGTSVLAAGELVKQKRSVLN